MRAYYPALNALGLIIMIFGLLMGFPLGVSMWLDDGATLAYDQSMFATFVVGLVIWVLTRGARRERAMTVASASPAPIMSATCASSASPKRSTRSAWVA